MAADPGTGHDTAAEIEERNERLTEALRRIGRLRPDNQPSSLKPGQRTAQCFRLAQEIAAAVLADEEDAGE